MEKDESGSMPTMFPPPSEYSFDQLQLLKPSKASESTENLDINNSMGNALLDMFNFNASCGSSNTGCSASLEKMSFADVMQFADYGPKLSLNQAMDDQNEQIERDPEHAFDPVFFLKFPVLASDQKAMDHKLLDHHIHDEMTVGADSEGNYREGNYDEGDYHANGSDGHGVHEDIPTSENASNLKQELNLSTNSNNTNEKLGQNIDHQQMVVPLDGPKLVGYSSTSYRPEPPQSKPKRKRSRVCKNSEEVESQRMTHIAVERNRRKQMNEHLRVLRSLMPGSYVQRGDQASIIGGAIEFVRELEQLLQCLESQKRRRLYAEASNSIGACRPPQADALAGCLPIQSSFPVFPLQPDIVYEPLREDLADNKSPVADIEVKLVGFDAMIKILSQRRPGQLLKTITALENLQFSILHTNITTIEQTVLYSFNVKMGEDCRLSAEDIANSVQQIFNMIHATCIGYIKD